MRPGPKSGTKKKLVALPPLDETGLPRYGPTRRVKWIEKYCIVPKGYGVGKNAKLRPFQKEINRGCFRKGTRTALISIPRGNGKTSWASYQGLYELFAGQESAEVIIVASNLHQAGIIFRMCKRMIELNPELESRAKVYENQQSPKIEVPSRGSVLLPLPAIPDSLYGYDPTLLIMDELHTVTEEIWEAASSGEGKRPQSLTLAISTPADSENSVMWRLVDYGRKNPDDSSFFFLEYGAPEGCDIRDKANWYFANPALACKKPFLAEDSFQSALRNLREPTFRRLRLGQWTEKESRWLPWDSWAPLETDRKVKPDEKIVAFFDGSASGDSTALVGCTLPKENKLPHLFVIGCWENPKDERWRVPRQEVSDTVDFMFGAYDVLELACDPWGWRTEIESWAHKHGLRRVIEMPTNTISRMAPATDRFYQAVKTETLSQDGDERMARHINNCIARSSPYGDVIIKDRKNVNSSSTSMLKRSNKIDLAVCAIGALDRAWWHVNQKKKRRAVAGSRRA